MVAATTIVSVAAAESMAAADMTASMRRLSRRMPRPRTLDPAAPAVQLALPVGTITLGREGPADLAAEGQIMIIRLRRLYRRRTGRGQRQALVAAHAAATVLATRQGLPPAPATAGATLTRIVDPAPAAAAAV